MSTEPTSLPRPVPSPDRGMLIVDAQALQELVNFIANAPLPMGRDALVQAVLTSARPAQISDAE